MVLCKQSFLALDQDERLVQPVHVDPQHTLRAYMDDQYAVGPPGSLAFECALNGIISQHHAGLVPNIDKGKLKTGMFIPHMYDRIEELKALFPGVIISEATPPQERGVKMLGSILRNSHQDYVKGRLEHTLKEAINTYALPLLHLHNLQDRYHIMHKSFMQRFTHLFRTLPPSHTQDFADLLADTFVRLFDYCTGGRRTKLLKDPSIGLAEQAHYYRLFMPYKEGGMGLADPHMLRRTAYLGCWTSLLTYEGAERWKRSFPDMANFCTDLVLGDGALQGDPEAFGELDKTGDLLTEFRVCQRYVASPSCRQELPCPHGAPPVVGTQARAARGSEPRAGGNDTQGHTPPSTSTVSKLITAWRSESLISFQDLENTDGPRGTKAGQNELSKHAQQHTSKLIRKALLDNSSNRPESEVLSLIRTHASIVAGSAPNAAMTFVGIPSDARSTLTNEEWRINAQLRLSLPLASYYNQPHAVCPHGCRHPLTKEPVNAQFGWHLVTNCPKANQGKKSHHDVEAALMYHINNHTHMTATKAKFFQGDKLQADIFITGVTTIDNPAARNWYLDVTSTNPMGATNQEFINRAALGRQLGPEEHDPRNDVLTSAKRAEERKHTKYDAICAATGSVLSPFALETTGGHGASTASVYFLFKKHLRDSGLPADVLLGKLKKDISFALRRGTIAQVTTALDAGQRAAEAELALNMAGWDR